MEKKDAETERIENEAKEIRSFVESDGWKIVKDRTVRMIADLSNAFDIKTDNPQQVVIELRARQIATDVLHSFIRSVEGSAQDADEVDIAETVRTYIVREE